MLKDSNAKPISKLNKSIQMSKTFIERPISKPKSQIDQMQGQISSLEDRILSLTKVIKNLQASDETQEQEIQGLKEKLNLACDKSNELVTML